ncbi:D-amino-acid transaminase [Pseudogemmobacter faecipullorum]|uniref:Probable branched-chain-amino-acid aminotransferase n=1 Tax=Pseudogemmobacter faecipullorum TaxID=2755041 RepID=A0ABS8CNM5_9RHOB|nr:D-amino-acid transaminase [Pseudogemmobacter faecipullorum]MCB5410951.1 D-amino-acid transaminase [Pseudogemmobacter faecipullorum]
MSRIVYLDGTYLPETEAKVSIFDRGFLMADAVYEVTSVLDGRLIDFPGHLARLGRSLSELSIRNPLQDQDWLELHRSLIARNGMSEGLIYLQVSRGNPGDRDFAYPAADVAPTVVAFTQSKNNLAANPQAETGLRVISLPDMRWVRRDIKTVQLLPSSMAKMAAKAAGVDEAWFTEAGLVTEGTSSNVFILKAGHLITRPLSQDILHGITRRAALRLADEAGLVIEERAFSIDEAQAADEAFLTSASSFVLPVTEIDGIRLGDGKPGPVSRDLRRIYIEEMRRAAM